MEKTFLLSSIIFVAIVMIAAVSFKVGYKEGLKDKVCKECPYFYHSYHIEQRDYGERIFVYQNYNSTNFQFYYAGDDYFSLVFRDFAYLNKTFDVTIDLRYNITIVRIVDIECLDKYMNDNTLMLPDEIDCEEEFKRTINHTIRG